LDKAYYQEYYIQERNHWWFLARLKILENQVAKLSKAKKLRILNIGAATGATSQMLEKYGEVTSLEYDGDCCQFVRETLNMSVIEGSILELPFDDNSFDLVCAFDVIEHIEDDKLGVKEMKRVCDESGHVFVTVPAYMSLWSDHDVINHHFRRYVKPQLKALFTDSGNIKFSTYFNSIFFLPIYVARKLSNLLKGKEDEVKSDFNKFKPGVLNSLMYAVFLIEKPWLSLKLKFPFGVSIMLIWQNVKKNAR